MLGLEIPGKAGQTLGTRLDERGVVAGMRGNSLRIAPHLHTTRDDLERLLDALAAAP